MSAWELTETPSRPSKGPDGPKLRRVANPDPGSISRLPFVGFMILLLALGMAGLLLLNTHLQDQAIEMRRSQAAATALADRLSDLEAQVNRAEAPSQVAGRATELGMVPNPHAVYVDLATGKIVGDPIAASGDEIPSLKVQSSSAAVAPQPTIQIKSAVQPWFDLRNLPANASTSNR
ncbi:hypothetical protein [Nigerium massiliense]|uniref:hypothetical protein n=1 Tax=Nigerium massiliense TaxID=1522317 RepID=UPI000693BB4F|nr:hypothetical protein [Nigerium massiliense]